MTTSTNTDEIVKFLHNLSDNDGIPNVGGKDWEDLNAKFTKQEIKIGMAEYVSRHSVMFPFRKISQNDMSDKFNNLQKIHFTNFIMNDAGTVVEKYNDYKYPYSKYGKFVISYGHYHNDISNFFQQRNRYDCGSYGFVSPNEYWYSPDLLQKMNWTFWRMEDRGINQNKIRGSFRLGAYVATQFKPHVAKTVYDFAFSRIKSESKTILDFSMGWGDRLAGFYTSSAKKYTGIDPNPSVFRVYKEQCIEYEKLISGVTPKIKTFHVRVKDHFYDAFRCVGSSGKEVVIYNSPAEDIIHIIKESKYDCIFTSPPYFCTELYDEGGDDWKQSWFRYQEYSNWWNKFYQPIMLACYESLTDDGIMLINIMDPKINTKRYTTCDEMVDYILSIGGKFNGQIGMRIKQRPKNMDSADHKKYLTTTFIENVWCFSKKEFDLSMKSTTLEGLFGD